MGQGGLGTEYVVFPSLVLQRKVQFHPLSGLKPLAVAVTHEACQCLVLAPFSAKR